MKHRAFAVTLVVAVVMLKSPMQKASSNVSAPPYHPVSKTVSSEQSRDLILKILSEAKLSGSFEFSGSCKILAGPGYPEFPLVLAPQNIGSPPLHSLRELFAYNPAIRVTQSLGGTIRIVERGVPKDILELKIRHVAFGPGAYDPDIAVEYILWTPEVRLFTESHHILWPFGGLVGGGGSLNRMGKELPPTAPRISGSWDNITVAGALDRVLKTFPCLWVYQNCPSTDTRQRIIYFELYELPTNPQPVLLPIP
jgi:hypothetical protein